MFKKYNSIENSYRQEFLDRIKGHGFWEDEYIIQEKVHGANLSYWSENGEDFYSAKRNETIKPGENFYNHHQVLIEILPKLKKIWTDLKDQMDDLHQLTIFGEIIGGNYPHKEVPKDKSAIKVQKGIYYSPKNHFYAFDILVNRERYLDVEEVNLLFEKHQLLHAKTLFKGSLNECLQYPNDFNSTIPAELGLPALEPNIAEGVVIRPIMTRHFNNGTRIILKNKNEKWSENNQFHKRISQQDKPSEKVLKMQEAILTYVTENRLNNVLSKIGEVTEKDIGKVIGLFNKDITNDFLKDFSHLTDELEKKELKLVTKSFLKTAAQMVKARIFR